MLHTRAELYFRFLQRRLGEAPARPLSETKDAMTPSMSQSMKLHRSSSEEPTIAEMDVFEEETYKTSQQRKEALEKVQQQKKEREKKLDKLLHRSSTSLRMQVGTLLHHRVYRDRRQGFSGAAWQICPNGTV